MPRRRGGSETTRDWKERIQQRQDRINTGLEQFARLCGVLGHKAVPVPPDPELRISEEDFENLLSRWRCNLTECESSTKKEMIRTPGTASTKATSSPGLSCSPSPAPSTDILREILPNLKESPAGSNSILKELFPEMPPPEMPGLPDGPSVHDLENSMRPPGQPINLFDALATECPVQDTWTPAEMGPEPCREASVEAPKASGHEISIFQALSSVEHVEAWQAFAPALPLVSPLPLGSPPFVEHTQLLLPELMHLPVAPVAEGCEPLIPEAGDESLQMTPRGNSEAEGIVKDVLSPPMSPDIFSMNTTPQKWLEYSPGVARSKTSASALGHYRLAPEDTVKRKMWI